MLEAVAQVGTLPRRVLDDGRHAVRAVERHVDGLGNQVEALLLGHLAQVAPGVEVQPVEPQLLAAAHLVEEGLARLLEPLALGMAQIDEVGVVGQNLRRGVAQFGAGSAERGYFCLGEGLGHPLALVFGEECKGRGADAVRVAGGILQPARGADVCSDVFHGCVFAVFG